MRLSVENAWLFALAVGALSSLAVACTPEVGSPCTVSTDCASDGTRICDTSEPGGYCTILNCTGNNLGAPCPEYDVCILFNSNVPGCPFSARTPARSGQSQCRAGCNVDSDCREGYICVAPNKPPYSGEILDPNQTALICIPALGWDDGGLSPINYGYDGAADAVPAVCQATGPTFDAGFPVDATGDAVGDALVPDAAAHDGGDAGARDGSAHDGAADGHADAADAHADARPDSTLTDAGHPDAADAAPKDAGAGDATADGKPKDGAVDGG